LSGLNVFIAVLIENRRAYRRNEKLLKLIDELTAKSAHSSEDLKPLLSKILLKIRILTRASRVSIMIRNEAPDSLTEFLTVGTLRAIADTFALQTIETKEPGQFSLTEAVAEARKRSKAVKKKLANFHRRPQLVQLS